MRFIRDYVVKIAREVFHAEGLPRFERRITDIEASMKNQDVILSSINNRFLIIEELYRRLDESVISMKKRDLTDLVNERLSVFEGNMDDKIVGFWRTVEEKFNHGNGNGRAYVGLMKRLAQLEGLKDAVEHRRSTAEIIERRNMLQNDIPSINNSIDLKVAEARLADLEWVLGNEGV